MADIFSPEFLPTKTTPKNPTGVDQTNSGSVDRNFGIFSDAAASHLRSLKTAQEAVKQNTEAFAVAAAPIKDEMNRELTAIGEAQSSITEVSKIPALVRRLASFVDPTMTVTHYKNKIQASLTNLSLSERKLAIQKSITASRNASVNQTLKTSADVLRLLEQNFNASVKQSGEMRSRVKFGQDNLKFAFEISKTQMSNMSANAIPGMMQQLQKRIASGKLKGLALDRAHFQMGVLEERLLDLRNKKIGLDKSIIDLSRAKFGLAADSRGDTEAAFTHMTTVGNNALSLMSSGEIQKLVELSMENGSSPVKILVDKENDISVPVTLKQLTEAQKATDTSISEQGQRQFNNTMTRVNASDVVSRFKFFEKSIKNLAIVPGNVTSILSRMGFMAQTLETNMKNIVSPTGAKILTPFVTKMQEHFAELEAEIRKHPNKELAEATLQVARNPSQKLAPVHTGAIILESIKTASQVDHPSLADAAELYLAEIGNALNPEIIDPETGQIDKSKLMQSALQDNAKLKMQNPRQFVSQKVREAASDGLNIQYSRNAVKQLISQIPQLGTLLAFPGGDLRDELFIKNGAFNLRRMFQVIYGAQRKIENETADPLTLPSSPIIDLFVGLLTSNDNQQQYVINRAENLTMTEKGYNDLFFSSRGEERALSNLAATFQQRYSEWKADADTAFAQADEQARLNQANQGIKVEEMQMPDPMALAIGIEVPPADHSTNRQKVAEQSLDFVDPELAARMRQRAIERGNAPTDKGILPALRNMIDALAGEESK